MVLLPCSDWKMVLACSSCTNASGADEEGAGLSRASRVTARTCLRVASFPKEGGWPLSPRWACSGQRHPAGLARHSHGLARAPEMLCEPLPGSQGHSRWIPRTPEDCCLGAHSASLQHPSSDGACPSSCASSPPHKHSRTLLHGVPDKREQHAVPLSLCMALNMAERGFSKGWSFSPQPQIHHWAGRLQQEP